MAEEGDPFGGLTQDELNDLMVADARRAAREPQRGMPRPPAEPRRAAQRPLPQGNPMHNDHGDAFAYGGFNSAMMGARGQNNALQGMAGDVMQAFQNENQSRVAQAREMRRMEHERELERMRQQTEQQRTNALIQRLQQNSGGYMNPAEGLYLR